MVFVFPRVPASVAAVTLCLLLGPSVSLAAVATIDVGAAAVGNEWRPASCDAVKDGVVLTNMVANVTAVIEGCTITLPAGSAPTTSAIAASAFGDGASLEIRGCTVTAPFQSSGYAIKVGGFGHGSGFILNNSTVSVTGVTAFAVEVRASFSRNDVFVKIVNGSTLQSVASSTATVIYYYSSSLGDRTVFTIEDSLFNASCPTDTATALATDGSFGHAAAVTIARSRFLANAGNGAPIKLLSSFGDNCSVHLSDSLADGVSTSGPSAALTVGREDSAGLRLAVTVAACTLQAHGAGGGEAHGIHYRLGAVKECSASRRDAAFSPARGRSRIS